MVCIAPKICTRVRVYVCLWCLTVVLSRLVTVFTETLPTDVPENASQSVPMVTTSVPGMSAPADPSPGDERDEVFMEAESEGYVVYPEYRLCSFEVHGLRG